MKRVYVSLISIILLILLGLSGCSLIHHDAYKDSTCIVTSSADEIRQRLHTEDDFWVFVGERDNQTCIDFQWELDRYLKKHNKSIFYLDTNFEGEEYESLEAIWEQLGFEEEEEVHAVLHLSNGYRIKRYNLDDKDAVKAFKSAYASDHITSNDHVSRITITEFESMMDKGDSFWVYMGRPGCYNCRVCYRWLIKTLESCNRDIYYVLADKDFETDEEVVYMDELIGIIDDNTIPIILSVKNGSIDMVYSLSTEGVYDTFAEAFAAE